MNPVSVFRRHVTLLEILIVMAIVAVAGGAVAIGVRKALEDQNFQSEVATIVNELRLAQDLMLILGTDVHVKFAQDDKAGGNKMWMELETRLPPEIEREVLRKHGHMKMVRGIFFRDMSTDEYTQGLIDVRFLSNGMAMSRGMMRLATSEKDDPPSGTLEAFICLPGYPAPIHSVSRKMDEGHECNRSQDDVYDAKLTDDTLAKLPEALKKPEEEKEEEQDGAEKNNDSSKKDEKAKKTQTQEASSSG